MALQEAKAAVLAYHADLASLSPKEALERHYSQDVRWRGVEPFGERQGIAAVAGFYEELQRAFKKMRRRGDVLLAGSNEEATEEVWVCSMGHFLGLLDEEWLGIPATGRLCFLRYCEFSRVQAGSIVEACMHVDVLGVMQQAGVYPLPPATGAALPCTPGPLTHDGLLLTPQPEEETRETKELLQRMMGGLKSFNEVARRSQNSEQGCPPEVLAETWHDDMLWWGPTGVGSTGLSIKRYQRQHQLPFRKNLYDKAFQGHVARIAEGKYEAWFGWPNLTNRAAGGFLGLPGDSGGGEVAELRVVDVYRREGEKLAENWVFFDMLHYLKCRGLDVLGRMRELRQLGDE